MILDGIERDDILRVAEVEEQGENKIPLYSLLEIKSGSGELIDYGIYLSCEVNVKSVGGVILNSRIFYYSVKELCCPHASNGELRDFIKSEEFAIIDEEGEEKVVLANISLVSKKDKDDVKKEIVDDVKKEIVELVKKETNINEIETLFNKVITNINTDGYDVIKLLGPESLQDIDNCSKDTTNLYPPKFNYLMGAVYTKEDNAPIAKTQKKIEVVENYIRSLKLTDDENEKITDQIKKISDIYDIYNNNVDLKTKLDEHYFKTRESIKKSLIEFKKKIVGENKVVIPPSHTTEVYYLEREGPQSKEVELLRGNIKIEDEGYEIPKKLGSGNKPKNDGKRQFFDTYIDQTETIVRIHPQKENPVIKSDHYNELIEDTKRRSDFYPNTLLYLTADENGTNFNLRAIYDIIEFIKLVHFDEYIIGKRKHLEEINTIITCMEHILEIQQEKLRQKMTCKQFLQLAREEQNKNCRLIIGGREGTLVKVKQGEDYGILFDDGCIEDPNSKDDARYVEITFLTKDGTEKVALSDVEMDGQSEEEKDGIITKILNKKLNIENLNSLYDECEKTLTDENKDNYNDALREIENNLTNLKINNLSLTENVDFIEILKRIILKEKRRSMSLRKDTYGRPPKGKKSDLNKNTVFRERLNRERHSFVLNDAEPSVYMYYNNMLILLANYNESKDQVNDLKYIEEYGEALNSDEILKKTLDIPERLTQTITDNPLFKNEKDVREKVNRIFIKGNNEEEDKEAIVFLSNILNPEGERQFYPGMIHVTW